MERKRKNKKQVYMIRRLLALLILIILIAVIVSLFKKLGTAIAKPKIEDHNVSTYIDKDNENLSKNERNAIRILENSTVENINKEIAFASYEKTAELEDLSKYRLEKMKLNSMGKGAKQAYLKKQVFLTFDDGPSSKSTEAILDILKEEDVKATFFVVGKNALNFPDVLKRVYDEGHTVAIHTYSHDYKNIYSSPEALEADINKAAESLKSVLGENFSTNLYRFPGGSWRKNKEAFVEKVESMGYIYFDWNVLNGDAKGANPSVDYLVNKFDSTRKGYNVILSLMHDTNAKTNTVSSLRQIIRDLKDEGFEFKSLGEV